MTPEFIAERLIAGLLTGAVYALLAIGLSIVFGVIRIVNFAHGEMLVVGMYLAWLLFALFGIDPLMSIPIAGLALFVFGYLLQRHLITPFITRPDYQQFLLMVAVATIMVNGLLIGFGPDAQSAFVPYGFDSFEVGPLLVDKTRAYAAGVSAVLVIALYLFFGYTSLGTAIRACADNTKAAVVVGLNVRRLYAITFGIGAGMAGIAGCLLLLVGDVHPFIAVEFTLLAFIVVIVGGLGSMTGALLGGLLIGVSEAAAAVMLTPSMKGAFSFALLILVLLVRPQGIMGNKAGGH